MKLNREKKQAEKVLKVDFIQMHQKYVIKQFINTDHLELIKMI